MTTQPAHASKTVVSSWQPSTKCSDNKLNESKILNKKCEEPHCSSPSEAQQMACSYPQSCQASESSSSGEPQRSKKQLENNRALTGFSRVNFNIESGNHYIQLKLAWDFIERE
eukprot:3543-Heterococcus_DN1.PRE.3